MPDASWQRRYVHSLRNALDYLPRKRDDDCLTEQRWLYDRRGLTEETFSFCRLPRRHHKHLKSTNMLERLNEELRRRTRVVRVFPSEESCLRLVRALAVETHEEWAEGTRYPNMDLWAEHRTGDSDWRRQRDHRTAYDLGWAPLAAPGDRPCTVPVDRPALDTGRSRSGLTTGLCTARTPGPPPRTHRR